MIPDAFGSKTFHNKTRFILMWECSNSRSFTSYFGTKSSPENVVFKMR